MLLQLFKHQPIKEIEETDLMSSVYLQKSAVKTMNGFKYTV